MDGAARRPSGPVLPRQGAQAQSFDDGSVNSTRPGDLQEAHAKVPSYARALVGSDPQYGAIPDWCDRNLSDRFSLAVMESVPKAHPSASEVGPR
jgi:hypothetical protein